MGKAANKRKQDKGPVHTGIDLFFQNITKEQAEHFNKVLNSLDRTMGGYPLKWELSYADNRATITTRYPARPYSVEMSIIGLQQNRMWCETGLERLGMHEVEYTGSEFYVKFSSQTSMNDYFAKTRAMLAKEAA